MIYWQSDSAILRSNGWPTSGKQTATFYTTFLVIWINNGMSGNYEEEQLWNEEFLLPAVEGWQVGAVLCTYERLEFYQAKHLAQMWALRVDKVFGNVKRGKSYDISQRIEKVLMMEFAEDKRGWHINAIINKPESVNTNEFCKKLRTLWIEILNKQGPFEVTRDETMDRLAWVDGKVEAGWKIYAIKERTKTAKERHEVDTSNDLLVKSALTIHKSMPEKKHSF